MKRADVSSGPGRGRIIRQDGILSAGSTPSTPMPRLWPPFWPSRSFLVNLFGNGVRDRVTDLSASEFANDLDFILAP